MSGLPSTSVAARLARLAARFGLDADAVPRLERLTALVTADSHAPTTVRAPGAVIDDHLADSLVALELEAVATARAITDLGSGAGFPGIPLAIARPSTPVVLVESNGRKADFIARAIAAAGVSNATVIHSRAEECAGRVPISDLVTARALAPLPVVLEYAAPLLAVGGSAVVWRGERDPNAEAEAEASADQLGLQAGGIVHVRPYPAARQRHLHLFLKVSETPPGFPRRPGMALKRPLGGSRPTRRLAPNERI